MAAITMYTGSDADLIYNPVWCMVAGTTVGSSNTDPTAAWTPRTLVPSANWSSICFGDKLVVAVATASAVAGSSPDGVTWLQRTLPESKNWQSVIYGNGTFVAVANGATSSAVSIDGGTTWASGGVLPGPLNWFSVAYGTASIGGISTPSFVAVATSGATFSSLSIDNGSTWTRNTMTASNWQSVCYGNGKFVAVGYNSNKSAYSTDGSTWIDVALPNTRNWSCVCYGAGLYVAVAYNTNVAVISPDGINWTEKALSATANWNCVSYGVVQSATNQGLGLFVVTANTGTATSVSYDGSLWVAKAQADATFKYHCYAPFPWNSGDTLTVQNNAEIAVTTNQNKFWKSITATYGKLKITNIAGASASGNYFQMGRVTSTTVNAITTGSGLFPIEIQGAWIQIGTGASASGQTFSAPFTEYIPTIEVETSTPDVYEVWCNVTGAFGPYMKIFGKDDLEFVGNGHRGNYFKQLPVANPVEIITLTGGANINGSYYITYNSNTSLLPGANIIGTSIPPSAVINRIISDTKAELNIVATASNTGSTWRAYNPFRSQLTSTIVVGDDVNGNTIPLGRKVRCANLMITDSSPANISATSHLTDAAVATSNASSFDARICLFGTFYGNFSQPSSLYLRNVGFAYQFLLNECYNVDMDYIGIAASPTYWVYTTKWICRDQRYHLIPPAGYTIPPAGAGQNAIFTYITGAKIKNLHKVTYAPMVLSGTGTTHLLTVSLTNNATFENIRLSCLMNGRAGIYGFYFSDSAFNNTLTNLEMYGMPPLAFNNSADNTIIGCEYSLGMNNTIQAFKTLMRICDDPNTGLPLVDNTPYFFKVRSFRSWMDRSLYYESNEYSSTPFQGGWQFPDYLSIRPNEVIARSVVIDWVQRLPLPAAASTVGTEIYRSTVQGFTERSRSTRVYGNTVLATVTCTQGVKVQTVSNGIVTIMTFDSAGKTITRSGSTAGSWLTDGFAVGDIIYINGSYCGNDGDKTITVLTATIMTVSETLYTEVSHATQVISFNRFTSRSGSARAFTFAVAKTIACPAGQAFTTADGFAIGDVIDISGCRYINNNKTVTINALTAILMTVNEPLVAEVTPTSTSTATRIMTFDSGKTITLSGVAAGSWITDGHYVGGIVYVDGSLVGNTGPFTITNLTPLVMTVAEAVVNEVGDDSPVTIVYRRVILTLRQPADGIRYYYRFRKYNFNSNATLNCSCPGQFISTTRAVTSNVATITTSVAHGYIIGQSVSMSGFGATAGGTVYNGTYSITTVPTTTTFTYALTHANETITDPGGLIVSVDIRSTSRECTSGVATITTNISHLFVPNQYVVISGMTDGDYNGTYKITSVPTTTTFTYAVTHTDEGLTADTGGTIINTTLFSGSNTTTRQVTTATSTSAVGKTMTFNAAAGTIVLSSGTWAGDGFLIWDTIYITGSLLGNDGTYVIKTIATTTLTIDGVFVSDEVGDEDPVIVVTGQPMAQLTTPIVHGLLFGQTIFVAGMTNSGYGGTFSVRAVPTTTTVQYPVSIANEGATLDNTGKISNYAWNFDNVYYLSGFQFGTASRYITNLVNNIYNSMFMPGLIISGQGIAPGTKVVSVDSSGREMVIDTDTTTSTDAIFNTTFTVIRRSVTSNVATIVTSVNHNLNVGSKIRLTSMTDSTYNGTYVVTVVLSANRLRFALTHADEVEVINLAGVLTVVDIVLMIPAQAGLGVYGAIGVTDGIKTGTTVVSVENSYMLRLSQIPDIATQYSNVFFQTFNESPELTCVPRRYVNATNFCLQNRVLGTTWQATGVTVGANTYESPTTNDWATSTMDSLTATTDNGYISMTASGLAKSTVYCASAWVRADQTLALPLGVTGSLIFGGSDGTQSTSFTADNQIRRISATASTGAAETTLRLEIKVNSNAKVIHVGDVMINLGPTPQAPITTTTTPQEYIPSALPLAQLRAYCRPLESCGTVGNQGIEINLGTAPTDTYFNEIYVSSTPGFTPSATSLAATTFAADTSHFTFVAQAFRNKLSNITKIGHGSAAAALGVFYFTGSSSYNTIKDCDIDIEYGNSATLPIIYFLTAASFNLIHNIDFGRIKSYQGASATTGASLIMAQSLNSLTGNRVQNIRANNYDVPIVNNMLNTPIKALPGGMAFPGAAATTYALGAVPDGVGVANVAVYGSQFFELYTSSTTGILYIVMEASQTITKPYTIKAGLPTFKNTGLIEMINANSVATVSRARSGNVATIVTSLPHRILLGDEITVANLGTASYNGTQTVTSVPTTTSFTYANTGSDEIVTADTAGVVTVGDSIEFEYPYRLMGISGFRKLFPKILCTDLGTQTDFPDGLRLDVSIKTGDTWSAYVEATPTTLNALSVVASTGFYFKFKITVLPFMKYGTMTNPMYPGDTIEGTSSGVTAVVVKNNNYGLTGTLILSKISGTFFPGELIRNASDDVIRATNVVTNGFAMGPSYTSSVNAIQFYTNYTNQNTIYPTYSDTLTITVLNPSLAPVEGSRVRVTASETAGGYTIGDLILTGLTNASGIITGSVLSSSNFGVSIRIRKSTVAPFYKSVDVPATFISESGLSTTIVLVSDE